MGKPNELELVIRRAVELAERSAVQPGSSLSEPLPTTAVAEIAAELDIPPSAVAQALAEGKVGANRRRSFDEHLVGWRTVSASHRTGLSQDQVQQSVAGWLEKEHGLRSHVSPDGLVVGTRRRGAVNKVANAVRKARGSGALSGAGEVRAAVVSVTDTHTGVSVVADVTGQRTKAIAMGSSVAATTAGVSGLIALFTPVGLVGLPVAAGLGYLVARLKHQMTVRRYSEAAEQTVSAVVAGQQPAGSISGAMNRLRRP